MKYLFLLILCNSAIANECDKHPIYCNIIKVKPTVNKTLAMELSNHIYKYSKEYDTNPIISVAIAMQESSLRNIDRKGKILNKQGRVVTGISDIGIFQIHIETAKNNSIDMIRLRTDLEYQVMWHVKILAQKIRVCKNKRAELGIEVGYEWSCYHSYTLKRRLRYKEDVSNWLRKGEYYAIHD